MVLTSVGRPALSARSTQRSRARWACNSTCAAMRAFSYRPILPIDIHARFFVATINKQHRTFLRSSCFYLGVSLSRRARCANQVDMIYCIFNTGQAYARMHPATRLYIMLHARCCNTSCAANRCTNVHAVCILELRTVRARGITRLTPDDPLLRKYDIYAYARAIVSRKFLKSSSFLRIFLVIA